MATAFADITFTPSVKAAQNRYGSREINSRFELADDPGFGMTEQEVEFIGERDSFYQATVSETDWPYVQHRGGPKGFLKVLDEHTIGFADFRGNVQYLSVGNLNANDRISLILMDYPNRRRLKLWGRVRIVHENEDPDLIAQLEVPSYRARVERGIVIHIEAREWNCPQHITPRYSEAEVEKLLAPLLEENRVLKSRPISLAETRLSVLGDGPLELVISGIRQLTPAIRAFELRSPDGNDLPEFEAGAHISVPVRLADDELSTRHYSICSDPARRDVYECAVLLDENGMGGSNSVHKVYALGLRLRCGFPQNNFKLHADTRPAILIAGGIGITPIKAMAHALKSQQRAFNLHYAVRNARSAAFLEQLKQDFGDRLTVYDSEQNSRINLDRVLSSQPTDAVFYICGPNRLIEAATAAAHAIDPDSIRLERFTAVTNAEDRSIEVELRLSNKVIQVAAQQTVLDAVHAAGIAVPYDCRVGNCGTCAVKVLEGVPDHRDLALSKAERERAGLICLCVSRARTERLVLDL